MARDVYQDVTDKILVALEAGTRPWIKPWSGDGTHMPKRANGKFYRGINVFMLWCAAMEKGYTNATWMTYDQAKKLGGQVRKGEKAELVIYASKFTPKKKPGETAEPKPIFMMKGYHVFNVEQIDGLPERFQAGTATAQLDETARIARADAFFAAIGASVEHGGSRAAYSPMMDKIMMPPFVNFASAERYYDTFGHEHAHWTGHETRLDRPLTGNKARAEYAYEELIAELSSAYISAYLGLANEPREDHASYLASWLQGLRNDKRMIVQAASAAQRAADYLVEQAAKGGVTLDLFDGGDSTEDAHTPLEYAQAA